MWYQFVADNSETLYGWTRNPRVAEAMERKLNRRREIHPYSAEALGEDRSDLEGCSALLCDDDTSVTDVEES